uniref:CLIP-associating protein 1-B-like isoform X3 n=1 Tax=Styela clava TaxID=7725 RepID=UPI00193ABCA7|nr:CLIP-associating protein 1-B-like isoform X3 [Styela clava]
MDMMDQDQVLLFVREPDMLKRMDNGQKLIEYLSSLEGKLRWDNLDRVIDSLSTYWVTTSNFKVSLLGLDILSLLVERMEDEFQFHYNSIQHALIDRLGDQKEQVRSASVTLLTNIMEASASPQFIFDRLTHTVFSHKVWRVRESVCILLSATINRFGARSLALSKVVPHICKLLSDPNVQVRETALSTLGEIYRHVGEKVRQDIQKRGLPPNRLAQVLDSFDEIYQSGKMEMEHENETASVTSSGSFGSVGSTTLNSSSSYMKPPTTSYVPNNHRASTAVGSRTTTTHEARAQTAIGRRSVAPKSSGAEAGAIDEETFIKGMDKDLPTVRIYNSRDFEECMNKIHTVLSDEKKDWEERSKTLRILRAAIVAGALEYDSFAQHIRTLEPALRLNARDLRSQVVRETCITIGHLSIVMQNRFDHAAELLFPTLFNLVPNSVKIMATSGVTTIKIILRNTHAPRLLPVITGNCTSKSTAVRRKTFGFLSLVLQEWTTNVLEKQLPLLIEAVKKGISDADSDARSEARKSWWGLRSHFPAEAEKLYNGLTSNQQKMIQGELTASSSTDSIPRSTASESHITSKRPPSSSSSRQSLLPNAQRVPGRTSRLGTGPDRTVSKNFMRSRSDIDPEAAKRSAMKAMTYGRARQSTATNGRPERRGRNTARPATSQRSQSAHRFAGSRSNSPNSKSRYQYNPPRTPTGVYRASRAHTYSAEDSPEYDYPRRVATPSSNANGAAKSALPTRTPPSSPTQSRKSRIPISTSRSGSRAGSRVGSRVGSPQGSRGSSPHRYRAAKSRIARSEPVSRNCSRVASSQVSSRDSSPGGTAGRGSTSSTTGFGGTGPPMRVLPKGREGEQVLTDALFGRKTPKRRGESYGYSDNDDDFSDTSSVCSDRSSSYQSSRNGVRRSHTQHTEDIAEILTLCQSTNWAERKEGLISLHGLIKREKLISRMEMKKILEIFNRMFADPHGKVFSLFLEILPDFVATYKENIEDWLYVLMTQLLKKMGADLLGSVQGKVMKAMQTTRVSFSPKQQFTILTRYIVDQTQTPNLKVKVALLHYLLELIVLMDSADINSTSETRLAISRMITWTTEPKSQDVRKAAESVITGLFELNPGEFSQMLRVLPKTFQDGAMKVLHTHVKANGEPKMPPQSGPTPGRVTARVGMSPSGQVVSPHGSVSSGMADIMSPRGSEVEYAMSDKSGGEGLDEKLNFGDITAEIHKLRLDSSADTPDFKHSEQKPYSQIGGGDAINLPNVCYPPPFQQLQNTPTQLSANRGVNNKYNPGIYSDKTINPPYYNKEALKEAMFDDDDTISDEFSQEEASLLMQLTNALQKKSQRKVALMDFRKALRSGDTKLFLSGKSYQWENYFVPLLMHVLECAKDEEAETRVLSLAILKEMFLRISWENFADYIETIVYTVLEAHKDRNHEVVRAAEDTTTTLGTYLPPDLCFQVLIPFLDGTHASTTQASIIMLTNAINKARKDELSPKIVNDIVPCLIKGYDSTESSMRKAAVFCLVAIHQVIGEEDLQKHLSSLSGSKMKLLQLYIKRAQTSSH